MRLVTRLAPGLGAIRADPGQMSQVLMNLAVNARDAMPGGGQLTLETAEVLLDEGHLAVAAGLKPGPHVCLSVSDTGVGMDAEIQRHLFEPFFTTKPRGTGTGLGLSTVYGILQQSGGWISVDSEPGNGTTFRLWMPRDRVPGEPAQPAAAAAAPAAERGSETVLLVEDQDDVRRLTAGMLARLGYRVLEAGGGDEALAVAAAHQGAVDLLLTDVVMRGLSGPALASKLREVRPEARVLFMSGYTDSMVAHHGVLQAGVAFLQKPFTARELAGKLREALARAEDR